MTQFVEQLRNQAKWYAQPGHNARDLMDSHLLEKAANEIECLRAKIEAMEQQEPVAWIRGRDDHRRRKLSFEKPAKSSPDKFHWSPLYALPGAQPAPSVPEGWQLVPTAESGHPGIYKMLGALHAADNTPGMSEWESYRAMLSEAPEVKP